MLSSFLNNRSNNYQKEMSSPITGEKSCSRLSPYITYGNISLREIYGATKKTVSVQKTSKVYPECNGYEKRNRGVRS